MFLKNLEFDTPLVVSSPMPKYNTGSGLLAESSTTSWKGIHTIYENEVLNIIQFSFKG